MSTDSAILLMLAEQRQTIAALQAEIERLNELIEPPAATVPPVDMPMWDQNGPA